MYLFKLTHVVWHFIRITFSNGNKIFVGWSIFKIGVALSPLRGFKPFENIKLSKAGLITFPLLAIDVSIFKISFSVFLHIVSSYKQTANLMKKLFPPEYVKYMTRKSSIFHLFWVYWDNNSKSFICTSKYNIFSAESLLNARLYS